MNGKQKMAQEWRTEMLAFRLRRGMPVKAYRVYPIEFGVLVETCGREVQVK